MKVKFKFILYTKGKGKNDLCTVSLQIYYKKRYVSQDTGIEVFQNQFDQTAANHGHWQIIRRHPRMDDYNDQLKGWMDKAHNILTKLRQSGEPFSAQYIKSNLVNEGKRATDVFREVLRKDRSINQSTKESITTMISRLEEYAPWVFVNHIDYSFAKDFEEWLFSKPGRTGGPLHLNTVNKYIRDLVRMLDRCIKYDLVPRNRLHGYDHIRNPRSATERFDYLTFSELEKIEQYDFSNVFQGAKLESISITKDLFLFACYTGLRLGDLLAVKRENYQDGILTIITKKDTKGNGGKTVLLPIDKLFDAKPLTILKTYSKGKLKNKAIFSDRKRGTYQGNMRIIQPLLFPGKKISFHSGRRTFTTLLRELGVPLWAIQRYLGHTKVETTVKHYDRHTWSMEFSEIEKAFSEG